MLDREQAALAESGFVALQVDYRNYAGSSRESGRPVAHPLGYPEDVINAVRAVKQAKLPFVDTSRIGLFGRSMGGGVVLNALVAQPHLAKAAVLYSPVSSSAADNYQRWVRGDRSLRQRVVAAYGTPAQPAGLLAAGQLAQLPRPRRGPAPDRPRHRRPGVPGSLERGHDRRRCEPTARTSPSTSTRARVTASTGPGRCSCTEPSPSSARSWADAAPCRSCVVPA